MPIGWSEMLLLAVVAIVVVGPKELPHLMRVVGHWMGKARAASREFQQAFDDLARESELEEMRRKMDSLRNQSLFSEFEDDGCPAEAPPAAGGNGAHAGEVAERRDDESAPEGERAAEEPENRPVPSH
jgi:sec-independent protein translocase protein TatB